MSLPRSPPDPAQVLNTQLFPPYIPQLCDAEFIPAAKYRRIGKRRGEKTTTTTKKIGKNRGVLVLFYLQLDFYLGINGGRVRAWKSHKEEQRRGKVFLRKKWSWIGDKTKAGKAGV